MQESPPPKTNSPPPAEEDERPNFDGLIISAAKELLRIWHIIGEIVYTKGPNDAAIKYLKPSLESAHRQLADFYEIRTTLQIADKASAVGNPLHQIPIAGRQPKCAVPTCNNTATSMCYIRNAKTLPLCRRCKPKPFDRPHPWKHKQGATA